MLLTPIRCLLAMTATILPVSLAYAAIEDLVDPCSIEMSDTEKLLVDATAAMIPGGRISQNPDGTYRLEQSQPLDICPGSLFYGEGSTLVGRSAVLIGEDLLLTAPHSQNWSTTGFHVVFGLTRPDGSSPNCGVDFLSIPADNVYTLDGGFIYNGSQSATGYTDFGYLKLDRPVTDRQPLRIRRSGEPVVGDTLIATGYPGRYSIKLDTAGMYAGTAEAGTQGHLGPFALNLHQIVGGSGGPIFNYTEQLIETLFSWGPLGMTTTYDAKNECYTYVERDITFATNGYISAVESFIPGNELRVYPLSQVVHKALIGGTLQQPLTTYHAAPAQPNTIAWLEIDSSNSHGGTGGPTLSADVPDGVYSILTPSPINIEADISAVQSCGIWDLDVNVVDYDTGAPNRLRHRFEISMTETDVLPVNGWSLEDLGFPYEHSETYSITNLRQTTADITITSSTPWLRLLQVEENGLPDPLGFEVAPATTLSLSIAEGDTKYLRMEIDPVTALALVVDENHTAQVVISDDNPDCSVTASKVREVSFVRGRQTFEFPLNPQSELLPPRPGEPYSLPVEFDLVVSDQPGLSLLGVGIDIPFASIFTPISTFIPFLKIELESPDGHTEVLWDQNSPPPGSSYITGTWMPGVYALPMLRIDSSLPPLGGGDLTNFVGRPVEGTWKVRFYTASGFENSFYIAPWHVDLKLVADY